MTNEGLTLTRKQALAIWHLLLTGEEPSKSEWKPKLDVKKERKPLEKANFVRYEKRGRRQHVIVTEKAWEWASRNLTVEISDSALASKSLMALLRKLDEAKIGLGEIVPKPEAKEEASKDAKPSEAPVAEQVERAYLELSHQKYRSWVRLADLRKSLSGVSKEVFEDCLLELQDQERIYLFAIDDRARLKEEDKEHAVWVAGEPKHTVYFEPSK